MDGANPNRKHRMTQTTPVPELLADELEQLREAASFLATAGRPEDCLKAMRALAGHLDEHWDTILAALSSPVQPDGAYRAMKEADGPAPQCRECGEPSPDGDPCRTCIAASTLLESGAILHPGYARELGPGEGQ